VEYNCYEMQVTTKEVFKIAAENRSRISSLENLSDGYQTNIYIYIYFNTFRFLGNTFDLSPFIVPIFTLLVKEFGHMFMSVFSRM